MQTLRRDSQEDGRYCVGRRPLHAGDVLELEVSSGHWLGVRFEWQHTDGGRPRGYFVMGLARGGEASVYLPVGAPLRWPEAA